MRVLITGVTGFAGGHLAEALLVRKEIDVVGISRYGKWPSALQHLDKRIPLIACDLADSAATAAVVRDVHADCIMHLAGFASVAHAEHASAEAWSHNVTATRNLYEAVRVTNAAARVVFAGSGLVYAASSAAPGPDESAELRGRNVYAASKCAADLLSAQYARDKGLHIVRARPLNHIGPRQSPEFAVASFARQIALIESGRQAPIIETGNLSAVRDLTDVRDVVQAYIALAEQGRAGEAYNIASERLYSIQAVLEQLLRLSLARVEVRCQDRLLRSGDPPVLRINAAKLRRETGWQPRYTLQDTLRDTLNYWRANVGQIRRSA